MVSRLAFSFNDSLVVCFKTLFFKSCGNKACLLGVAYFWGFKNSVDSKFPRVTKSFVDKLLSKLVKNVLELTFSKLCIL